MNKESVKVIDNCLDVPIFKKIKSALTSYNFPWYWSEIISGPDLNFDSIDNAMFSHGFFIDYKANQTLSLLEPIFDILRPKSLVRVKANLYINTSKIIKHGFHVDTPFDCSAAILYINTNDGYTYFEDRSMIESVENRLVIFSSSLKHGGTTTTNQQRRILININYF